MNDSKTHWQLFKTERESSRNEIAQALTQHGADISSSDNLRCPFHNDKRPSATLKQTDGKWFFCCHAGSCNVIYDIWDLDGLIEGKDAQTVLKETKKQVLDEYDRDNANGKRTPVRTRAGQESDRTSGRRIVDSQNETNGPRVTGSDSRGTSGKTQKRGFDTAEACVEWVVKKRNSQGEQLAVEHMDPYTDPEDGTASVYVVRLLDESTGKKSYTQAFYDAGTGRWGLKKPTDFGPTPIFNRNGVRRAKNILMVEGEGCVRAFTKLKMDGWAATTTLGGAGKAEHADLSPLAGKTVYTWADNDAYSETLRRVPGEHHMQEITEKLLQLDPPVSVRRVRHEDLELKEKGDIVDYLKEFKTKEEKLVALKLVFQDAESVGAAKTLRERFEQITSGEYEHIQIPDAPILSRLSNAWVPGTVTLVCGDPGVAKSFWVLEKSRKLHNAGRKVKVLMLEEDFVYWQQRAIAQLANCADLSDLDWIRQHPDKAMKMLDEHEEGIESFSRRISIAPSRPTMPWVAQWVAEAVAEGNEVIFVDPITAAANSDKAWLDDHEFLFAVKEAVRDGGARLVLTSHPKLDVKSKPSLASIAGGAAWPRFSQTVLWLRMLDKPEKSHVDPGDGNLFEITHEREIQIRKSRNGRGAGSNIATLLDRSTLCFVEAGEIVDLD